MAVHSGNPGPIRVRLETEATLTGRLVDAQGKPRAGTEFQVYYLGHDLMDDYIYIQDFDRRTDPDGRFKIEDMAPGLRVRFYFTAAQAWSRTLVPLKPGENRDLGDVRR
jgi:hypothetical protein